MSKGKRKSRVDNLPPSETSEELTTRLRAFAERTRKSATALRTVPFPENVTVLAGPLRRVRRQK